MASSSKVHEFAGAGAELVLHESGDPGGRDLVLLHGAQDLPLSFDPVLECIARWRVWRPELRGHGASDHPGSYTLAHFVADLHILIRRFTQAPVVLVGHSLGGHVSARYASLFPEDVAALALLDGLGPPRGETHTTIEGWRIEARQRIEELTAPVLKRANKAGSWRRPAMPDLKAAAAKLVANNPGLEDDRAMLLAEEATEPVGDGLRWRFDERIHSIWTSFSQVENELHWAAINCPVLLITGDRALEYWTRRRPQLADAARYEADLARREGLFKNASSHVIAGAGHMLHYDQPDVLANHLADFLATVRF